MIKKIFALLLVSILLFSCGKKGDPVYKEKNQNSKIISAQNSALS
tara:strand:- start:270 stop:404 length:135 start_codon:yes stop_codon:yes gene_type:complete